MKPIRLYLKNFKNHLESEIDFSQFSSALIVGRNHKNDQISNGVGKTTLLESIEYVLYNEAHSTTLDKLVKFGKKRVVVEYDFEENGEIYRVYRSRTNSGSPDLRLYRFENGEFLSLSGRTAADTEITLRDIVKLSHKAFTYSILVRQADLTGLAHTDDASKRKEMFKEPMNLTPYSKLEKIGSEKLKPIKKEIDKIEGSIAAIGKPDEDILKAQEDLQKIFTNIDEKNQQIKNLEQTIAEKTATLEELKQSLSSEDSEIHKTLAKKEEDLKSAKNSLLSNQKRLETTKSSLLRKQGEKTDLITKLSSLSQKLTELSSVKLEPLDETNEKYKKICSDEITGSEMLAAAKAKINFTKSTLPDSDICPACKQSISPDYRSQIEKDITTSLEKQKERINSLEDNLSKCRKKKTKLEDELKKINSTTKEISKIESEISYIEKDQKNKEEDITRLSQEEIELNLTISNIDNQISSLSNTIEDLKEAAKKSNAPVINERILKINKEIAEQKAALSESNNRLSSLISSKGGLEERIKSRTADKDKLNEYKDSLLKNRRELKLRQMVVDGCKNIPGFIVQTVLDDLQFDVSRTIKELRPELDIKLDSDLNIFYKRNGQDVDYNLLSHGQHVYIALSFKRALSHVLQKRMNCQIQLLCFDEVDAHLDEAGVAAFADCIKRWQKDFVILVITHNKDLKDKFTHAIVVEEGTEGSEARVVTHW